MKIVETLKWISCKLWSIPFGKSIFLCPEWNEIKASKWCLEVKSLITLHSGSETERKNSLKLTLTIVRKNNELNLR